MGRGARAPRLISNVAPGARVGLELYRIAVDQFDRAAALLDLEPEFARGALAARARSS